MRKAIEDTKYTDSYKIAREAIRCWETEYNIDGGIRWLSDGPINMVWYPSAKMHSEMGVIISGYGRQRITAFNAEYGSHDCRVAKSRGAAASRSWQRPPQSYVRGLGENSIQSAAVDFRSERRVLQRTVQRVPPADDRIYFAGDYCSHLLSWQEGAALSAHRTVKMIGERARLAKA